jgi:hypothetical protein
MRRWGIAVVLLVSAVACGPVTPTWEERYVARVTRQLQQADEVRAAQRAAEPIFRAHVAGCVKQLPAWCVRAIDYYVAKPPHSMTELQEIIKVDTIWQDDVESALSEFPSARIRGPHGCEFGYRKCMAEADPSGEFNKWNSYWDRTDTFWGGSGYAAGYDDGYEDGQDDE